MLPSAMELEMMLHEQLQELSVEFSEELQVILKALKRVAEGKARALEDAAKWKRKYEIEKLQNLRLQNKAEGDRVDRDVASDAFVKDKVLECVSESSEGCVLTQDQNSNCCIKDGICAEKILWKQNSECGSAAVPRPLIGKASFTLSWVCKGNKNTQHEHDIVSFERGNITTAVRRTKQIMLKWDSPPRSVLILTKPNSKSVEVTCQKMVRWLVEERRITIYVEPRVRKNLAIENVQSGYIQTWKSNEDVFLLHSKVDLVCTLGGDGTVLWAASLFKGPVPPFLSFSLGSLGFMTPFQSDYYKECINTVMRGPVSITLRHRLQGSIIRAKRDDQNHVEGPILVLNEVTIDRGMSPFLTLLECYCDDSFVTCVQGDGLILSTTSGSTAYSLAAGGSMVHPQVPAILFTPICPHSLSFRPIIFPEYVTLRVQVPYGSRGQASVAFDGKDRKQLKAGDALICNMSSWPVPTICEVDSTHDFLRSVREGLHWNLRKSQSFDGPKDV